MAHCAVEQTAALWLPLPPDPDADQGSGACLKLLPVEPGPPPAQRSHLHLLAAKAAYNAECCRRCVPERRQSAGPDEATHAGRVRQQRAAQLRGMADCQQTCDPGVIELSRPPGQQRPAGLQRLRAQLDVAVHAEPAVLQ